MRKSDDPSVGVFRNADDLRKIRAALARACLQALEVKIDVFKF